MRRSFRPILLVLAVLAGLVAATPSATAITGGTEDTANKYSNVGMLVFYQPDGRFRCSGTLIAPRVFLTAAHCTYQDFGKVVVTFDPLIARTAEEAERDVPRAGDDSGPSDAHSSVGYTAADISKPKYKGDQTWFLGRPVTHPQYSDFTDINDWNDTGVVILEKAPNKPTTPLAPVGYLNQFTPEKLNSTSFLTIGYGTEVRKAEDGPQSPTPQRLPLVRRYTTEIGQKLTDQVLQTNSNEHDPRAEGGTCGGDSGGPILHGGYIVGDTSYGYTANCRYIGGYQRVDIAGVRSWIDDCTADLVCPTKS